MSDLHTAGQGAVSPLELIGSTKVFMAVILAPDFTAARPLFNSIEIRILVF